MRVLGTIGGLILAATGGAAASSIDSNLLSGLSARSIGPAAVSGRIAAIDVVVADPRHMVVGAATGGVWSTTNGGLTWTPIFDDQPYASIGAVAIDQSNPDVIWVGTGETNVRNSTSIGGGVFKSIDGGHSWQLVGLPDSERIRRIAIDPRDPDVVYVAALGTLWGPNDERGLYKTTDGGQTWSRILHGDNSTGATDIKIDPHNPDKLYAALWQFRRWPYFFKSGGPGSGLFISHDGGASWDERTTEDGLPKGELGRIAIAPSPADPNRVYALVEAEKSALMRSDDGGRSWNAVNTDHDVAIRPMYYTEIFADPVNADRIYNVATRVRVSIDGGKTFETNPVIDCCAAGNFIHIDNHAFWINPDNPDHLVDGNDGGIGISHDRGATWRFVRNLPLAQFYHIAVDNDHPYNVYGGLQDNGSWRGPAEVFENGGIRNLHWQEVGFGDGFDTIPDPRNSKQGYAMSQGGNLSRWNLETGESRRIFPIREDDTVLRFNWSAGFALDPSDPDTIYYGSQFVHKSTDRGVSWQTISDDLTTNNPQFQTFRESGGLTFDVTAAENYTSIVALAVSPLDREVIWAGADDGRVHVTRDGGQSWTRVDTRQRAIEGAWVPMIYPSRHDPTMAFVVLDDHRRSNMTTYAFRLTEYGQRWERFGDDDFRGYALSIVQDHVDPDLLFLGTELGLYFTSDGGDDWHHFTAGVPTVSVMDLAIQAREDDLVLGTHGRAIFILDDYGALRGLDEGDFEQRLALLDVTPGQQYDPIQTPSTRFTGSGEFRADNEPYGVMITFIASGDDLAHPDEARERARKIARRAAADSDADDGEDDEGAERDKPIKVTMRIETSDGELVRERKMAVHQGVNRVVWDLSSEGVRPLPGPEPRDLENGLPGGPEVPPGTYVATLSLGEYSVTTEVDVLADPRSEHSVADREAAYVTARELVPLRERIVTAVERIVHVREDVDAVLERIKRRDPQSEDEALAALKKQAGEVKKGLTDLEKRFRVPPQTKGIVFDDDKISNQLGIAQYYVGSSWDAPGPTAMRAIELAREALAAGEADLNAYLADDVAGFRDAVAAAGIGLLANLP